MERWFLNWDNNIVIVVCAIVLITIAYYLVLWIRDTRRYRDSADDHLRGCVDSLSWGCWLPVIVLGFLISLLL